MQVIRSDMVELFFLLKICDSSLIKNSDIYLSNSKGNLRKEGKVDLIPAIREGNSKVLNLFYEQYRSDYLNWAQKQFPSMDRDLLIESWQEAIIAFYEQIQSGRLRELHCEVKTYMFVLAKRYLIKLLKNQNKTVSIDEHVETNYLSSLATLDEEEDFFGDQQKELMKVFEGIGGQCKELLLYKFMDGLSVEEIKTKKAYKSLNSVSASLSRCLRKLKNEVMAKISIS